MRNNSIRILIRNALIAALYFVITLISAPISFLGLQIRLAEILILLCFFRRDYIFGLTIGCALSNLLSPLGLYDVLFGTLATLFSCFLVGLVKNLLVGCLIPIIINGFVVGAELYFLLQEPFWINVGTVALGEFIALAIGYILLMIFGKKQTFLNLIKANRNLNFKW